MPAPTASEVFRDYVTSGVPASGKHDPKKAELRQWGNFLEEAIINGGIDGGGFLRALNDNAGGANNLIVTTSVPPTSLDAGVLISVPITQTNTGPATIKINDAAPIPILTNSGEPLSAGFLQAGAVVDGYIVDGAFRLRSDVATAADRAAAEAAAAEAAAQSNEAELSANRAINASAYGYNGGRFLLGFENGVGFNFIQKDAAILGGNSPVQSALPETILSLTRASSANVINNEGLLSSVASGAFAFTRDTYTGRATGLFVGAGGTSLVTQDFSLAEWAKSDVTLAAAGGVAPDGTSTAFLVTDTSATLAGTLSDRQDTASGLTTAGYATFSVFVKPVTATQIQLRPSFHNGGTTFTAFADINLLTKTVATESGCTANVTVYADGWLRVDVTVQNNSTGNTGFYHRIRIDPNALGEQRSVMLWKPTVYIGRRYLGTISGRADDRVSMPLSAIDWNALEGTLCCDVEAIPNAGTIVVLMQVDDGTENNRISIIQGGSTGVLSGQIVVGGVLTTLSGVSSLLGGRIALSWSQGKAELYFNGDIVATATTPDLPSGLTTLRIGSGSSAGTPRTPNTTYKRAFYKSRQMTAAEIATAGVVSASSGGGGGDTGAFSQAEIGAIDGAALAQSAAVRASGNPYVSRFMEGFNWIAQYGQSLSVGALGHPPRSWSPQYDAVMIGGSVRGSSSGATFTPYGSSAFNPLAPTVEGGGAVLNASQIEALAWTDANSGETSAVGFTEMAKFLWNQHVSQTNDTSRKFVVTSTGAGGLPIASLQKGTNPFSRTVSAGNLVKTLAASTASQLHMVLYEQGESDRTDGSTYAADLLELKADLEADLAEGIFSQPFMPGFFYYQVSDRWAEDSAEPTTVGKAQLDLALDRNDMFLYAPNYRVTSKPDGHLDANGYRWLGMMLAKCWYRVVVKGEGWKPMHMTGAYVRGAEILVAYHVPVPPLKFGVFYDEFTAMDYATKGFRVVDDGGSVPISAVEIVGGATIKLTLSRETTGTVTVKYATKTTFNGGGNVMDSDNLQSLFNYEYLPAAGDDASANVAALVGKPYPLENPACLQNIEAMPL